MGVVVVRRRRRSGGREGGRAERERNGVRPANQVFCISIGARLSSSVLAATVARYRSPCLRFISGRRPLFTNLSFLVALCFSVIISLSSALLFHQAYACSPTTWPSLLDFLFFSISVRLASDNLSHPTLLAFLNASACFCHTTSISSLSFFAISDMTVRL